MTDCVYDTTSATAVFHSLQSPSAEQVQTLLNQIIKRVMKQLTRTGYIVKDQGITYMAKNDAASAMTPLDSAAGTYHIALGPCAAQKVFTLQTAPAWMPNKACTVAEYA